jgi:hypothetical protein
MARYGPVEEAWAQQKYVRFYPLASSYNGAVAEDTWRVRLDRMGVAKKAQYFILLTAVQAICEGFSNMVDFRHGAFNILHSGRTSRTE